MNVKKDAVWRDLRPLEVVAKAVPKLKTQENVRFIGWFDDNLNFDIWQMRQNGAVRKEVVA